MAFEQRDMSFSMFENEDRRSDKAPKWSGKIMVDGVLYYMDAWENETRDGRLYLNGKVKEANSGTRTSDRDSDNRGRDRDDRGRGRRDDRSDRGCDERRDHRDTGAHYDDRRSTGRIDTARELPDDEIPF